MVLIERQSPNRFVWSHIHRSSSIKLSRMQHQISGDSAVRSAAVRLIFPRDAVAPPISCTDLLCFRRSKKHIHWYEGADGCMISHVNDPCIKALVNEGSSSFASRRYSSDSIAAKQHSIHSSTRPFYISTIHHVHPSG